MKNKWNSNVFCVELLKNSSKVKNKTMEFF